MPSSGIFQHIFHDTPAIVTSGQDGGSSVSGPSGVEGGDEDVENHDGAHACVRRVVERPARGTPVNLPLMRHEEADASHNLRHHRQNQRHRQHHQLQNIMTSSTTLSVVVFYFIF